MRLPVGYEDFPIGNPFPVDGDRRRYDPVTATIAGVGAATNLFSGIRGRSTANTQANNLERAAQTAGNTIVDTTGRENENLLNVLNPVNQGINAATGAAVERTDSATSEANALLAPYRTSGEQANETLRRALMEGGEFNRNFTSTDFQTDPGYQFRLNEQNRIANAQLAARGNYNTGSALRQLTRDSGEFASSEFDNAFQRYRQQNTDRYDRLFGMSGRGQEAATQSGANLIRGGEFGSGLTVDAANRTGENTLRTNETTTGRSIDAETQRQGLLTDAASAAAGARMEGSRALTGGIVGAGNAITGGLQLRQILQNPTSRVNYLRPGSSAPAGTYNGRTPPFIQPITSVRP